MTKIETMIVSISPDLQRSVAARIAAGHYRTASEVLHAALRLLNREQPINEVRPPLRREGSDGHVGPTP